MSMRPTLPVQLSLARLEHFLVERGTWCTSTSIYRYNRLEPQVAVDTWHIFCGLGA